MKFRTEITITPFEVPISHRERLFSIGSCFAEEIGERFARAKFAICCNPTGPLFNPLSILRVVERALDERAYTPDDLCRNEQGVWFLFDLPTRFTDSDAERLLDTVNTLQQQIKRHFEAADRILITFGTAWVYRLLANGELVANCHKQPQSLFRRERLTVEEIVTRWHTLIERYPAKEFIFTVSPIRHLGDGLEGNAVSKAILRLACEALTEQRNVRYFPAYEALLDDLRDYRFYAEDLCHPSRQAVDYITELFFSAALSKRSRMLADEITRLIDFTHHRPLRPDSEAYREQCRTIIARMEALAHREKIDFSAEITSLKGNL